MFTVKQVQLCSDFICEKMISQDVFKEKDTQPFTSVDHSWSPSSRKIL